MASPLTTVLQTLVADVAVEALPAIATLANQIYTNSKQPLALQAGADTLALMQAEQSLIQALPAEETLISGQINSLVQAKVSAWMASEQTKVAAA